MSKPPLLQAKKLSKTFQDPTPIAIIRDIDLTLSLGETLAIVGPSGSGKSTLLHILGTLEAPSSGTLTLEGREVKGNCAKIRSSQIGFIFQSFHLLEDFSAIQNVLMPARIKRNKTQKGSEAFGRAQELLELVGLKERQNHPVKLLSGGEKQRVSIARALMNNPQLILADEPTGNLDEATSQAIQKLLIDMAKKFNKSLIVVTHDENFAKLCDRTLLLKEGALHSVR